MEPPAGVSCVHIPGPGGAEAAQCSFEHTPRAGVAHAPTILSECEGMHHLARWCTPSPPGRQPPGGSLVCLAVPRISPLCCVFRPPARLTPRLHRVQGAAPASRRRTTRRSPVRCARAVNCAGNSPGRSAPSGRRAPPSPGRVCRLCAHWTPAPAPSARMGGLGAVRHLPPAAARRSHSSAEAGSCHTALL